MSNEVAFDLGSSKRSGFTVSHRVVTEFIIPSGMYCKQCGHRSDDKTERCQKCGTKLTTEMALTAPAKRKFRWQTLVVAAAIGGIVWLVAPRVFFRTELEAIGPTDKLRFLRAIERSEYRRLGQSSIRLEGQSLVVLWDLRWNTLPERKQHDIVRIVGHAWSVVGGTETLFRIEGEDKVVGAFKEGEVRIDPE
jgi:hypothetical protein